MMPPLARLSICVCLCVCVLGAAPVTRPTTATRPVAVDQTTPVGAMKVFATAMQQGDAAKMRGVLLARTPDEEKIAGAMMDTSMAAYKLNRAVAAKFGEKAAKALSGLPTPADVSALDSATVRLTGERAIVDVPGSAPNVRLARAGGQWQIVVGETFPVDRPGLLKALTLDMQSTSQAMQDIAADVAADKYKSADDARVALEAKIKAAILANQLPRDLPGTRPATGPATRP